MVSKFQASPDAFPLSSNNRVLLQAAHHFSQFNIISRPTARAYLHLAAVTNLDNVMRHIVNGGRDTHVDT
jgi:hypothetical protein